MRLAIFAAGALFVLAIMLVGCTQGSGPSVESNASNPQNNSPPAAQPQPPANQPAANQSQSPQPSANQSAPPAANQSQPSQPQAEAVPQKPPAPGQGRIVFALRDAAVDMGKISSIKISIDQVSVHRASGGWINVSSSLKTYDLISLNKSGKAALLSDSQLAAGAYDQVRLHVSRAVVTDASGEKEAAMPSGTIAAYADASVSDGLATAVTFDFMAGKSLHIAKGGAYVFTPVIGLEALHGVQAQAYTDGTVTISGGTAKTSTQIGMGLDGNTGVGVSLPPGFPIEIGADGKLRIAPS